MAQITTIDEYIMQFPLEHQAKMKELRAIIKEVAPQAKEKISWGMATFVWHKNLVHFAGNKHHIGFYPGASGVVYFLTKSTAFQTSKGTIKFPLDQPLPKALIADVVRFRIKENEELANV